MRILFLCRFLPHSLARDSGRLDSYHYIKSLCAEHAVSVIAFVPPEDEPGVAELERLCERVVAVPYDRDGVMARLWRLGGRLWRPQVYGRNYSGAYRRALHRLLAERSFDVAVVHGMMAGYGRDLHPIPAVLDEVDLFSMVAHQLYRNAVNPFVRLWLGFDWLRTLAWETSYLHTYQAVFVRSTKDEAVVRELAPQQAVAVLPPWFEGLEELQTIPLVRPAGNTILFVGAMNIPPNIDAVCFFAQQVFPELRQLVPDAQFRIVGAKPVPAVQQLSQEPGVMVVGEVPSLTPHYAAAAVVVAPLFVGGGIIVKTLNGMASGRPMVATPIGNSGTGAEDGRHLRLVAPDPTAMAQAIAELLLDDRLWQQFAQNGREFILSNYSWPKTITTMTSMLQKAVD